MFPIHRAWALALDAMATGKPLHRRMMDTEDFDTWVDELEAEYERYRTVCEQNGHTPCSLELIFWSARNAEMKPTVLLRARQAQRRP